MSITHFMPRWGFACPIRLRTLSMPWMLFQMTPMERSEVMDKFASWTGNAF